MLVRIKAIVNGEKESYEKAKKGICAVLCKESDDENSLCMLDVYEINSEAAKRPANEIMPTTTRFEGWRAWKTGVDHLEQICESDSVFVKNIGEDGAISGDGFATVCLRKILSRYPDTFYSHERD